MNREEAIANLNMISVAFVDPVTKEQRKLIDDTFEMAIKALEQEPKILETLDYAINASDGDTTYFVGFRNGLRYSKSLIDGEAPQFEICTEQEPCGEAIDRRLVCAFIAGLISDDGERKKGLEYIRNMPPVETHDKRTETHDKRTETHACDYIHRQDVLDLAKKGVLISNGNYESVCKAINELSPVNPQPCEDAINRQAVEDAIYDAASSMDLNYEQIVEYIDKLPSVNPQAKTGHWIMSEDGLYRPICDVCCAHPWKGYIPTVEEATEVFKYCPNCGAKMVEPQERSDKG